LPRRLARAAAGRSGRSVDATRAAGPPPPPPLCARAAALWSCRPSSADPRFLQPHQQATKKLVKKLSKKDADVTKADTKAALDQLLRQRGG
jgi:hypothetical protein